MANEHFIKPHLPFDEAGEHNDHHVSRASTRRREQEVENLVWEWRTDQVEHLGRRLGYVEGDQFVPYDMERLEEIRGELRGMCE